MMQRSMKWPAAIVLAGIMCLAQTPAMARTQIDLSGDGWSIWRDKAAAWADDDLYLPPVDIAKLASNPPAVGWETMYAKPETAASVPGTVEQYLWGADGDPHGTNGNYQGVSFWWRKFTVPPELAGKRFVLKFDSCRLRAEVFLDEKLVGYDCIGETPFECDVTPAIKPGREQRLAVRITNPNDRTVEGNYAWQDYFAMPWGKKIMYPGSRGFAGITGKVSLLALDEAYVNDIFVMNKDSADYKTADVQVELINTAPADTAASVSVRVSPVKDPQDAVFEERRENVVLKPGTNVVTYAMAAPRAKLWSPAEPNLYRCEITLTTGGRSLDQAAVNFGFRFFAATGVGTDAMLRLNGQRVVLRSAISWGYFPITGTVPTEDLARKQIQNAKTLGLNMLSAHRTIARPILLEKADELGLLYHEEPGGYKCDLAHTVKDANARVLPYAAAMARLKLLRMIRRDRNHPSLVMYNMVNEPFVRMRPIGEDEFKDMRDAHAIDPSRIITYGGGGGPAGCDAVMLPFEDRIHMDDAWLDSHNAGSVGVYQDDLYRSPDDFFPKIRIRDTNPQRYMPAPRERVVYFGEEGAISAPPQLGSIRNELQNQRHLGWDGQDYIEWHDEFAKWLAARDEGHAFKSVDDLCRSLGNIAYEYQGRLIENIRCSNVIDGYVINGWECEKLENHSGIVDSFRNFKGDPKILAQYNRPLCLAIKSRTRVAEVGSTTLVDIYVLNEQNFTGDCALQVEARDDQGHRIWEKLFPATIAGGDVHGQLLQRDLKISFGSVPGYTGIQAALLRGNQVIAAGEETLFGVSYRDQKPPANGAIIDRSGAIMAFVKNELGCEMPAYTDNSPKLDYIVVGDAEPSGKNAADFKKLLSRVKEDGTALIVVGRTSAWAAALQKAGAIQCAGEFPMGEHWVGGSFFALRSPLLKHLPQAQGMNWEYQCIQAYPSMGAKRMLQGAPVDWQLVRNYGLLLEGETAHVGCYNAHEHRLATALGTVSYGNGSITLSTLRILPWLKSNLPAAAVPKKLLCNLMEYWRDAEPK